jgi:hypothetical protein
VARLDEVLPHYDVRERHERHVDASPEDAVAAALGVPIAPDAIVRALFRLRGLGTGGSVHGGLRSLGFKPLVEEPACLVVGLAGRPWTYRGTLKPFASAGPGDVRMAVVVEARDGVLATETRVQAVDASARRAFRRYWLVVGPFSALIRRRWLAAAERALR